MGRSKKKPTSVLRSLTRPFPTEEIGID